MTAVRLEEYTQTESSETIDERIRRNVPMGRRTFGDDGHKDKDVVLDRVEETAEVVDVLTTVHNLKAEE